MPVSGAGEMMGLILPLLFITELLSDANLVIKIFVLLTIISFFVNHLGKTPISIVLILGVSYFVLFDLWTLFGGIYIIWMLLMFGVASVVIDFFFVGAFSGQGQHGGTESPVSSGADVRKRQAVMEGALAVSIPIEERLFKQLRNWREELFNQLYHFNEWLKPEQRDEVIERLFNRFIFIFINCCNNGQYKSNCTAV